MHSRHPDAGVSGTSYLKRADRPRPPMSQVPLEVVHDDHATGATAKLRRAITRKKEAYQNRVSGLDMGNALRWRITHCMHWLRCATRGRLSHRDDRGWFRSFGWACSGWWPELSPGMRPPQRTIMESFRREYHWPRERRSTGSPLQVRASAPRSRRPLCWLVHEWYQWWGWLNSSRALCRGSAE